MTLQILNLPNSKYILNTKKVIFPGKWNHPKPPKQRGGLNTFEASKPTCKFILFSLILISYFFLRYISATLILKCQ